MSILHTYLKLNLSTYHLKLFDRLESSNIKQP
jgi:hypothetical protein